MMLGWPGAGSGCWVPVLGLRISSYYYYYYLFGVIVWVEVVLLVTDVSTT